MKKYRVRLTNGRVVGPLEIKQFSELYEKKHIDGTEECQLYPTGDWLKISDFPEINEVLGTTVEKVNTEATFIKKISELDELKKEAEAKKEQDLIDKEIEDRDTSIEFPKKFEFEKKTAFTKRPDLADSADLTQSEDVEDSVSVGLLEDEVAGEDAEQTGVTETIVESPPENIAPVEDKTIVNLDTKKYLEELKKQEEINKKLEEEEAERLKLEQEQKVDLDNDSTQFINLAQLKEEVVEDLEEVEKDLKKEELKQKKIQKQEEKKKKAEELKKLKEMEDDDEDEDDQASDKKKKLIIAIALLAVIYVILFPDDGKKKIKKIVPVSPNIVFPQRYDIPDENKANLLHQKAIELLKVPTYVNKIKASKLLRDSVENKFNGNSAAGRLIFVYSQLLKNSNTITDDANTVFKLVQIFKTKALSDPLYATGLGLFYYEIEKYYASTKIIERFNAVQKNNPTLELFAVYLKSLLKIGDIIKAKSVAEKILTVPSSKRPLFIDESLIEYFLFNSNYQKASEIISESIKKYPESVSLLLYSAKVLMYGENFEKLGAVLKRIRALEAEKSKVYYSSYLEYRALESVKKGDIKRATKLFKKALKTYESDELRTRLSALSESTDQDANLLITESKALQFIASSKNHMKKNNWKFAFKDALEATRIAPHYIRAKLHLSELQVEQSIFKEAILALEKLYKDDPHNEAVLFALMNAYVESYKFSEVKRLFAINAASEVRNNPMYYSLTAKYYVYKNDFINGVAWLQQAINRNPLDDENIFQLAKMFIRYAKFEKGKMFLNKAMDLDPAKIEYRISFSQILYEMDGADAAIGYLYDILQDFPDNPKILSQIGIYHYRSGQQKSFESIKKKLKNLPHRDTSLYEFLIEAAKLDDKPNEVIKNSKKLIELNPGDLKTRLELGRMYMNIDKYKDALIEFKAIEDRLDTYPKLSYYMSKLYLLTDNNEKAIELAEKEIKFNPAVEDGYILLGDIFRKEKKFLEAEKEYKRAQKINGDNVDMLIGLATVNFKKSQYEIALDLFRKARDLEPSRSEIHKLLGDAYRKTSQSSLAIESYKMFLELSPNTKYKDEIDTYIRMME